MVKIDIFRKARRKFASLCSPKRRKKITPVLQAKILSLATSKFLLIWNLDIISQAIMAAFGIVQILANTQNTLGRVQWGSSLKNLKYCWNFQ